MPVPLKHLDTEGGVLCTGIFRWKCDALLVLPHPRVLPSEITCPDCIGLFHVGDRAYTEAVNRRSMAPGVARQEAIREARAKILSTARWAPERASVSCEGPTLRAAEETLALLGKRPSPRLGTDTEERLRHMQSVQAIQEKAHLRLYAAHMRRAFERRGLSVTVNDTGSSVAFHTSPKQDVATLFVIAQGEAGAFTRVDLGLPVEATRCTHAALHRGSSATLCGAATATSVATSESAFVNCPLCLHRLGPKLPRLTQLVADLLGCPLHEVSLLPYTGRAWVAVRVRGLSLSDEEAAVVCPVLNAYCDAGAAGKDHDPTCMALPYVGWKVAPVVSGGPVEVTCECGFVLGKLAEETSTRSHLDWPEDHDSIVPGGAQGGWMAIGRRALREAREAGEAHAKAEPDSHDAWLANPHELGSGLWAAWREGLWGELPAAHRLRVLGGCLQETGRAAFDRAIRTTPLTAGQLGAIVTPLRALLAELDAEHKALATPES